MSTHKNFLISSFKIADAQILATTAKKKGWRVCEWNKGKSISFSNIDAYYGEAKLTGDLLEKKKFTLKEPRWDFLCHISQYFLKRKLSYFSLQKAQRWKKSAFIKSANPYNKCFDSGVYRRGIDLKVRQSNVGKNLPVIVSEVVSWLEEYRCFIHQGKIIDIVGYFNRGRMFQQRDGRWKCSKQQLNNINKFVQKFCQSHVKICPETFVLDVGYIEKKGLAIVEANPIYCCALYGAKPENILPLLRYSQNEDYNKISIQYR